MEMILPDILSYEEVKAVQTVFQYSAICHYSKYIFDLTALTKIGCMYVAATHSNRKIFTEGNEKNSIYLVTLTPQKSEKHAWLFI